MRRRRGRRERENGIALLIAILTVLLLSMMVAGIITVSEVDTWTSSSYRRTIQARYLAEAGAQAAQGWLTHSYGSGPSGGYGTTYNLTTFPVTYNAGESAAAVVLSSDDSLMSSNFSDSSLVTSFTSAISTLNQNLAATIPNASVSVATQLLSVQPVGSSYVLRWKIISQGNIAGIGGSNDQGQAQARVVEVIANTIQSSSMFTYGLFSNSTGCKALYLTGNSQTESYDSTVPGSTPSYSGGDVGSMGNIYLGGSANVNGNAASALSGVNYNTNPACSSSSPVGLSTDNSGSKVTNNGTPATGNQLTKISTAPPQPPVTMPSTPPTGKCSTYNWCSGGWATGPYVMAPGTYPDVKFGGGLTISLQPGTYVFNSLTLSGGASISLPTSGQVIIYVQGTSQTTPIDLTGGSLTNGSGLPEDLQFNYGGTGTLKLSGGASEFMTVYAPNAAINMSGNNTVYGAMIGSSISITGGSHFVYDRSLARTMATTSVSGTYEPEGFSWSAY